MKIEDFIEKITLEFSNSMPEKDWELMKKTGNGYHELTYEEYRKNPEKWNQFNDHHNNFYNWWLDNSFKSRVWRLIKFSDKHYIHLYHSNRISKIKIQRVEKTQEDQYIHFLEYPWCNWCNEVTGDCEFQSYKDLYKKESGEMIPLWNHQTTNKTLKEKYIDALSKLETLDLCIVGQDRYPSGSNGIAFCKDFFDEFYDEYCCGKDVLYSLNLDKDDIVSKFDNPIDLFFHLLKSGVAFINICHDLINTHSEANYLEDKEYNIKFLQKAKKVVVLGTTNTVPLFEKYYQNLPFESLIHPSNRAKESSPNNWNKIWASKYLFDLINTDNEI